MPPAFLPALRAAALVLAACAATSAQAADDYPSRPVETIVPYSTGGGVSAMARAFAAEAARLSNGQWLVVNREGAGGVVGFTALARAKPDGYTVAFSPASPMTNSPFINANMPFRNEQIVPVCQVFENVFAIAVRPESPIRSVADLVAQARAKPGGVAYGHAGPGSIPHMSMGALERETQTRFNAIAYRGDGPLLTDTLGGTLDFSAIAISSLAGKNLRVLAVFAEQRHPSMPDVPSIAELGYKAISPGLNGLFVPAGTPKPVIAYLDGLCRKVTASPTFVESARTLLQVPQYLDAAKFAARIDTTYKVHASLVPDLKLEKN